MREIWDYKKANIENIKKAISNFDWNNVFQNLSVDEKINFLNKTSEIAFQLNVTLGNLYG